MTVVFANGPLRKTVIPQPNEDLPPISIYIAQSVSKSPLPATPNTTGTVVSLLAHHYVRDHTDTSTGFSYYVYAGDIRIT